MQLIIKQNCVIFIISSFFRVLIYLASKEICCDYGWRGSV